MSGQFLFVLYLFFHSYVFLQSEEKSSTTRINNKMAARRRASNSLSLSDAELGSDVGSASSRESTVSSERSVSPVGRRPVSKWWWAEGKKVAAARNRSVPKTRVNRKRATTPKGRARTRSKTPAKRRTPSRAAAAKKSPARRRPKSLFSVVAKLP